MDFARKARDFCVARAWFLFSKAPGRARGLVTILQGKIVARPCNLAGRDFLKGRTSRPWAKPRVGKAKRSAAHAQGIEAEIPQARRRRGEELQRKARFFCGNPQKNAPKFRMG
jgi:hypothetical protein